MKKLILLVLLFSTFSCAKDEPKPFSEQHTEQEIFNALIGTWQANRLSYDEDFKQIEYTEYDSCWKKYHITFTIDSVAETLAGCTGSHSQGTFYVQKQQLNGSENIKIKLQQDLIIYLSPTTYHTGGIVLHNCTDTTLIFSGASLEKDEGSIDHLYSEFKRVK